MCDEKRKRAHQPGEIRSTHDRHHDEEHDQHDQQAIDQPTDDSRSLSQMQPTCDQAKEHAPECCPQQVDQQPQERRAWSKVEDTTRHRVQQRLPSDERCRHGVQRCKEAHLQVGGGGEHGKQGHQDPTDHADECSKQKKWDQLTSISCCWHSTPPSLTLLLLASRLNLTLPVVTPPLPDIDGVCCKSAGKIVV